MKGIKLLFLSIVSLSAPVLFVRQAVHLSEEKEKNVHGQVQHGKDSLTIVQLKADLDSLRKLKATAPISNNTMIKVPPITITMAKPQVDTKSIKDITMDAMEDSKASNELTKTYLDLEIFEKSITQLPSHNKQFDTDQFMLKFSPANSLSVKYQDSDNPILRIKALEIHNLLNKLGNEIETETP